MKLIANDTLRVTAATPSRVNKGDRFDINDGDGEALVRRGLARPARAADAEVPAAPAKPARAKKGKN